MITTPALKEELVNWLDTYWSTYLKGDIATWATFIRDDYRNIGGTKEEIWNSKQEIIDYTHSILDQMLGTVDIRNRKVELIPYGEYMMVHEFTDLFVKIEEEWTFYGPFRMSSLLEKTDTGWIALHQHGSYPDMKAMEGEAFSMDALKAENAKLQAAVKSRTKELQQNNRELEIEAATERVRVQSMAMQHPDDLDKVNKEILNQLNQLQIPGLTGVTFYLINENGWVNAWDFSSPGNIGAPNSYTLQFDFTKYEMIGEPFRVLLQSDQDYFVADYPLEKLEKAVYELEEINPTIASVVKEALANGKLTHQWSVCARISNGLLAIDLINPPSEDTKTIVLKMAGAFNQAYQRFLDLQKAEAQAREAEIDLALERVRARTMAMQSSDELREAVLVINEQLQQLNIESKACNIIIIDKDTGDSQYWVSGFTKDIYPVSYHVPYFDHLYFKALLKPWKQGDRYMVYKYEGKDKKSFDKIFFSKTDFKNAPEEAKQAMMDLPSITLSTAFLSNGALQVLGPQALSEENAIILQRFAKVFNQTYIRFLDLQKAEAQVREAQIETGLERVRSRSLAMRHTSELQEVINTVHKELLNLNIAIYGGSFITINSDIDTTLRCWGSGGTAKTSEEIHLPLYEKPFCTNLINGIKRGPGFFTEEYSQEEKKAFFTFLFQHEPWSKLDAEEKQETLSSPGGYTRSCCISKHTSIFIINHLGETFAAADNEILKRFAKVFEQTYTRFLDLQKAEAQIRAAQIELAVERVRAKALAMHNSAQIGDVVETLRHEMLALEIPGVVAATIYLKEEDGYIRMWDLSSVKQLEDGFHVSLDVKFKLEETHPGLFIRRVWNNKDNYFVEKQEPHDMVVTLNWLRQYNQEQADEVEQYLATTGWDYLLHPTIQLAHGKMSVDIFNMAPPDEMESIMVKMGAAFDLAYKRFIDLQKSEQQTREAQIELALERVRTVAMTMSKPEDLLNISKVLFKALQGLNFADLRNSIIHKYDDAHQHFLDYDYSDFTGGSINRIPFTGNAIIEKFISDIQYSNKAFSETAIEGERLGLWRSFRDRNNELPDERLNKASALYYYFYSIGEASIGISTFTPITTLQQETLRRFRNVFDLAYQRYVDITKAAAQTREAQIELSLERIRAKVTAMKVSSDLLDIVVTMRTEFVALGHEAHYFWHMRWQPDLYEKAMTSGDGSRIGNVMTLPRHIHGDIPLIANWENSDESSVVYAMEAEAAVDYVIKMIELGDFQQVDHNAPTLDDIRHIGGLTFIMARTTHGEIGYSLPGPVTNPPADGVATLVRFAAVFDLAYRRFEDLKSSELQIREAQVELALERVRARTMAMQHSDELADASFVLDTQVRSLGIKTRGCAFNIYGDNGSTEWFSSEMGAMAAYQLPREKLFLRYFEAGKSGVQIHIEKFEGETCVAHYNYLSSLPGIGDGLKAMIAAGGSFPTHQIDHAVYFKYGYLLFITADEVPEAHDIFIRFAKVFEQTYTRFLDLQKAEAQAREAKIEAALEKARSRSMGMQSSDELPEVANVLFTEVRALGIPAWSCGYNILAEDKTSATCWMSSEGTLQLPFKLRLFGEASFAEMGDFFSSEQTMLVQELGDKALEEHYAYMKSFADLKPTFDQIDELGLSLPTYQINHLCKFTQGFLLFITYEKVPDSHDIFKRFTKVFEQTYTRFLDLQKAEAQAAKADADLVLLKEEKKRTEEALNELQVTQKQLIQAEKMASLGELTAGIAHEIQNPLNFVNNFSELSRELIDELKSQKSKLKMEEQDELLDDIDSNLKKINHHGKRADAIVKGMLQHSQSGKGQKEPTDINALCDEYLRLSYHGLRAKDKSFNATLKTDFEESIGKINIVPQDIGRVLLNLLNNAFYAVSHKLKSCQAERIEAGVTYEPTVSISTKKITGKTEIKITDNGNGIPPQIIDKIFQPFFTTKPTGQGTGLGLSLAYDIVKAHGGALKVETKDAEGTTFSIQLPDMYV